MGISIKCIRIYKMPLLIKGQDSTYSYPRWRVLSQTQEYHPLPPNPSPSPTRTRSNAFPKKENKISKLQPITQTLHSGQKEIKSQMKCLSTCEVEYHTREVIRWARFFPCFLTSPPKNKIKTRIGKHPWESKGEMGRGVLCVCVCLGWG